jgi:hypothetical protein
MFPYSCYVLWTMAKVPLSIVFEEPSMNEGDGLLVCNAVQLERALGTENHIDYILRIEEQTNYISLLNPQKRLFLS